MHTSLSQREVARRSRDGGFEGSYSTPFAGEAEWHSNPPARLAPTHLPLQKGGILLLTNLPARLAPTHLPLQKGGQSVAPITHTSLSQREVARRSRDGGF